MAINTQSAYGLTHDQVSNNPLGYFPFAQLVGGSAILGPNGGVVVIAGIDQATPPNDPDTIVQVFSSTGSNSGEGSAVVTNSADADGKLTFLKLGIVTDFWEGGVRIDCVLGDDATYFIVLQTGNNIPNDPNTIFNGTPPPPVKPSKPAIIPPEADDEWGAVVLSWTTTDTINTEVDGFRIWVHANYPGAVAYVGGIVPINSLVHPNYTHRLYIGANEYPDPVFEYTFTIEPYLWGVDNTLGEESDPSDPVIYDPEGPDEEEDIPDIELPDPDEIPEEIPEEPVPPDPPNEDLAPGTLTGAGYGGFNLGGSSLNDVVFMMNVSGIYTLVEGKTHDTLYERMTGITSQNVKIPDPFVKTGFIGE